MLRYTEYVVGQATQKHSNAGRQTSAFKYCTSFQAHQKQLKTPRLRKPRSKQTLAMKLSFTIEIRNAVAFFLYDFLRMIPFDNVPSHGLILRYHHLRLPLQQGLE
jgi:hypothetical protein